MKRYFAGIGVVALLLTAIMIGRTTHSTAPPTTKQKLSYVALGDSVAAGVGLKDDSDSSACDRTNQSYPSVIAQQRNYALHNIACSGATLSAGILGTQDVNQLLVTPQLQQLFAQKKPGLISLTIGANDVDWTTILARCYTATCGGDADASAVSAKLATVASNLQSTLTQIQRQYGKTPPRVIVTGYHQVFPATDPVNCTDLAGIDMAELAFGRQLQTDINTTIQQAISGYAFAHFVPIDFAGHELCTADPWVQGLLDKQPYHPTAAGQARFALDITQSLQDMN